MIESRNVTYDHLQIRCPKLGGQVTFSYCRREGGPLPCQRTVFCWEHRFPVEDLLKSMLNEDQWIRWSDQSPKEKVTSLIELIEGAKLRLRAGE